MPEPADLAIAPRGIRLADRLKAARADRGISQAQAARELDVARTAYRLWEMEAARPAPDRWRMLARWLGVSTSTLLVSEGLMSAEDEATSNAASERFQDATGETAYEAADLESGDFFEQAASFVEHSVDKGLLSDDEATHLTAVFEALRKRVGP